MQEKLDKYQFNNTSQYGEDGIIEYLINNSKDEIHKSCCEFGAGDGKTLSNTYSLWNDMGWSALLIEPSKTRFDLLKKNYGDRENLTLLNQYVGVSPDDKTSEIIRDTQHRNLYQEIVPKDLPDESLDDIYKKHNLDPKIGVLSIDIDSLDYYVFDSLEYVDPQIAIIEFNNVMPVYVDYVDPKGELFLRHSAKALERLGKQKGYILVACTVTNVILIKEELYNEEAMPQGPVEWLYDYVGQYQNGSLPTYHFSCQMVNRYPVWSLRPHPFDSFCVKVRNYLRVLVKFVMNEKLEKKLTPSENVKKALKEAGLHY